MLPHIRNEIIDNYKHLPIEESIRKLEKDNLSLKDYIVDFNYDYKNTKNNIIKRTQRIIIFGLENNLKLLDKKETKEFFIVITYKIIPVIYRPYKLLVISGLPLKLKSPILICFILIKYLII